MSGLVPGIHVLRHRGTNRARARRRRDVDARNKSGHDGIGTGRAVCPATERGASISGAPTFPLCEIYPKTCPESRRKFFLRKNHPVSHGLHEVFFRAYIDNLNGGRLARLGDGNAAPLALNAVMPGLVPGIHVGRPARLSPLAPRCRKTWMPGTSPGMTEEMPRTSRSSYLYKPLFFPFRFHPESGSEPPESVPCAVPGRFPPHPDPLPGGERGRCCRLLASSSPLPLAGGVGGGSAQGTDRIDRQRKRGAGISSGAPTSPLWEIWVDSCPGSRVFFFF